MHNHILMILDSLRGGGAERVAINLAAGLIRSGCQVTILLLHPSIEYSVDFNVQIEILPQQAFTLARISRSLNRTITRWLLRKTVARIEEKFGRIDLTLSSLSPPDRLVASAGLPNTHFMIHQPESIHLGRRGIFGQLRTKSRFRRTYEGKNIITVSNGVLSDMLDALRVRPNTIRTIYNPIDVEWIREQANKFIPQFSGDFLISVGRFCRQKRQDLLLRAFALSGIDGNLVLLGKGSEDAEHGLRVLARKLGIMERVHFAGFQPNPYPWISRARALVLSSDYEGLSMVILEALACGTPVVSTDCPFGPAEILAGNSAGILVPAGDEHALARAIAKFWKAPPKVPEGCLHKFTSATVVSQYMSLCKTHDTPS